MSDLESAKRMAVELGIDEPDDGEGRLLAGEYGMYGMPPKEEERDLTIIEGEILFYKRQAGHAFLEIGKRLNEAKAQLPHGEWLPWLREKVDISERSAQDFMRLAKEYSKSAEIADLGAAKALALLALEASEREQFAAEKHDVDGVEKSVAEMTAKELKKAIEERDSARKSMEAMKARAEVAEQSRAKMEEDMRQLKELQKRAREAEEQKSKELQRVEDELKTLRSKPVEVAVETRDASPEQLAEARSAGAQEARKEAEAVHQKALAAAEEKAKKLKDDLRKARDEAKAANDRLQAAEKEAREAREKADKSERLSKVNANENMVKFGVLFNQVQATVNLMAEAVDRESPENQEKMRKALAALAGAIRKAADNA